MGAGFARSLLGRNGSEFEAPEGDAARFHRRLRDNAQIPRALPRRGLHPRHRASCRSHAGAGIVPVNPLFFCLSSGGWPLLPSRGTSKQTFRQFLPQVSSCVRETLRVHFEVLAPSARRWRPAIVLHSAREVRGTVEWRRRPPRNLTPHNTTTHAN